MVTRTVSRRRTSPTLSGAISHRITGADKRMSVVPHEDVTYKIIGCAMDVHNALGPGLREGIYQRALAVNMERAGLCHAEEKPVEVYLDAVCIGLLYLDHLVEDCVVVEVK